MYIENSESCCAVKEIYDLRDHDGDSSKAMLEFCCLQRIYGGDGELSLASFYLFSGVERFIGNPYPKPEGKSKWQIDEWKDLIKKRYASKFAKFIRENKLGRVVTLPGAPNRLNHPKHIVKVFLWTPNVEALTKWYQQHHSSKG